MTETRTTQFTVTGLLGSLTAAEQPDRLEGGTGFTASRDHDGVAWDIPAGALTRDGWLTMDMLANGLDAPVFQLRLHEEAGEEPFVLTFGLLNACQARLRVPLTLCSGNCWLHQREGAWLKPTCAGAPVCPSRVTRIELWAIRVAERGTTWSQTPLTYTSAPPQRITAPLLPRGPLVDGLGQWTLKDWEGKSASADEVDNRLRSQLSDAEQSSWPEHFSKWGGWRSRRFEATGFFRTVHDGARWWLADPSGYAFFSSGIDCVKPGNSCLLDDMAGVLSEGLSPDGAYAEAFSTRHEKLGINYLAVHLIRTFGEQWMEKWGQIAIGMIHQWGFNTVGNWSNWQIAADAGIPYVRPLRSGFPNTPRVFRDFPDVFSDAFEEDVARYASQLTETHGDPAMIGYFLMNEPKWGFADYTPAEGMLRATETCAAREQLAEWLKKRYGLDDAVSGAWGMDLSLSDIRQGRWDTLFSKQAIEDLEAFSTVMVSRLFGALVDACRQVDPNHLNLGARYYTVPPGWALAGMEEFDVFSINCYERVPPVDRLEQVSRALGKPLLIGEWHFGALDVGLPASGICRVADQIHRGKAFRRYLESSAASPAIVGAHYFQLNDQSVVGRFDGENYNIGLVDVCSRPYDQVTGAARASHERLYDVADGRLRPYDNRPDYRERLFY